MRRETALVLLLALAMGAAEVKETALERLQLTTDRLVAMGEEMVGEPVSGILRPGDTLEVAMAMDTAYSYHIHVWTNSIFNLVEFWVRDPAGRVAGMAEGDHTTLSLYPDTSGEYHLLMKLHEADEADSAGYAAALFHRPRMSSATPEED